MRKMTKLFALALLVGTMASCSDDDAPSTDNRKVAVQLGGYIGSVETRASEALWTANDNIGVFMTPTGKTLAADAISEGVDNISYTTPQGDNSFEPTDVAKTIYFPISGTVDFYAYSPYATGVSSYKVPVNVADQNNQEAIDLMYAKTTRQNKSQPQVHLNFKHCLSYLVLDVQAGEGVTDAELAKLTIKVNAQNTEAQFNLADGTITDETASKDVAMQKLSGNRFVAILLPSAANSREVEFNLNNQKDAPFTWNMPTTLEAGTKYYYKTVKVSRTKVEISGTISPWTNVEDDKEYHAR